MPSGNPWTCLQFGHLEANTIRLLGFYFPVQSIRLCILVGDTGRRMRKRRGNSYGRLVASRTINVSR
ncbi:unnamed protein product [Periconia digitata]|uniref:Uncharacterized protein n=1 Tax=Periconia digitata TaxID=1303443 RepID=A0A9W4XYD5_9PLEO|nr:unnamed protein product [Periconia digitata]